MNIESHNNHETLFDINVKKIKKIDLNVLILGSSGYLAGALKEVLTDCQIYTGSHSDKFADVVFSKDGAIVKINPRIKNLDWVIFGSSIDGFDFCEVNSSLAFAINVEMNIRLFKELSLFFSFTPIVLSTDAVFSVNNKSKLSENILPNPLSVYAKTKHLFEVYIIQNSLRPCVIRMGKLWGGRGEMFFTKSRV